MGRMTVYQSSGVKAVVFGGAGFIGRHLVTDLLLRGYEVTVADIERRELPPGARFVECDVRKPISLDIAEPPKEVYNLAAVHRVPGHLDHEYFDTNVQGAHNITDYCRDLSVRQLCFTSSISVYGPSERPRSEESPTRPVSAYGRSKLEAERVHVEWASEDRSRRLVIARPAVIFGPGERGNFTRLAKALSKRTFVYPGRKETVKACAFVGELVSSFRFAMELGRRLFLYNLCYPHPYTISEICEAFHRECGLPKPFLNLPATPMLAAAWVCEMLEASGLRTGVTQATIRKLTESTHMVPKALLAAGFRFETDLGSGLRRWLEADPAGQLC